MKMKEGRGRKRGIRVTLRGGAADDLLTFARRTEDDSRLVFFSSTPLFSSL